jgi:hypothetical protein
MPIKRMEYILFSVAAFMMIIFISDW